jgi:hypothetical protein
LDHFLASLEKVRAFNNNLKSNLSVFLLWESSYHDEAKVCPWVVLSIHRQWPEFWNYIRTRVLNAQIKFRFFDAQLSVKYLVFPLSGPLGVVVVDALYFQVGSGKWPLDGRSDCGLLSTIGSEEFLLRLDE